MSHQSQTDHPPAIAETFQRQLEEALREPTLTHAMVYLCICEATRIAHSVADTTRQASLQDTVLPLFDSHYTYILTRVRDAWIAARKPLQDFQPVFCPPPAPH